MILGPLAPFLGEALKLTATQKGMLTAIPLLGGSFFRPILGWMTERIGGRRTGLIGFGQIRVSPKILHQHQVGASLIDLRVQDKPFIGGNG